MNESSSPSSLPSSSSLMSNQLHHIIKKVEIEIKDEKNDVSCSMLQCWNDEIEKSFVKKKERIQVSTKLSTKNSSVESNNNENNNNNDVANDKNDNENIIITIEQAANELHSVILKVVSIIYKGVSDGNTSLSQGTQQEEKRDKNYISDNANSNSSVIALTNDEADDITLSLADQIEWNYTEQKGKNNQTTNDLIQLLSHLIRASKNLIRWNRNLLAKARFEQRRNKHNNNSDTIEDTTELHGLNSCIRLCSTGMVKLYLILLDIYSQSQQEDTILEKEIFHERCIRDDLARNSCVALFHSTYDGGAIIGGSGPQSITGEPICKKSLRELTSPTSLIYGIPTLVRLLTSSVSVQVMLVLIKFVHNLVGSVPNIMNRIDLELSDLYPSPSKEATNYVEPNLISILVSTMTWCIRSKPPFPGKRVITTTSNTTNDKNSENNQNLDRRAELAIESIRVLFALQNVQNSAYKKVNAKHPTIMTQLGIIIVDILHLPNNDERVYEVKVAVLMLLMDLPKEFSSFLSLNHCIEPLLLILWIQLNQVVIEEEGMAQGQSRAVSLLPILILLNKLSQANDEIKNKIKAKIFPPSSASTDECDNKGMKVDSNQDSDKAKNINPVDAPPGTMRWKLIKLMTWTESNVKRCSSELLWTLCSGDSKEFVRRTGFGNAVHMLGIRGLVNIPTSNSYPTSNK